MTRIEKRRLTQGLTLDEFRRRYGYAPGTFLWLTTPAHYPDPLIGPILIGDVGAQGGIPSADVRDGSVGFSAQVDGKVYSGDLIVTHVAITGPSTFDFFDGRDATMDRPLDGDDRDDPHLAHLVAEHEREERECERPKATVVAQEAIRVDFPVFASLLQPPPASAAEGLIDWPGGPGQSSSYWLFRLSPEEADVVAQAPYDALGWVDRSSDSERFVVSAIPHAHDGNASLAWLPVRSVNPGLWDRLRAVAGCDALAAWRRSLSIGQAEDLLSELEKARSFRDLSSMTAHHASSMLILSLRAALRSMRRGDQVLR